MEKLRLSAGFTVCCENRDGKQCAVRLLENYILFYGRAARINGKGHRTGIPFLLNNIKLPQRRKGR
ncbi:hypothetical protein NE546_18625, partial [Neglectibacter timonensis]|uniref:hypothetical protein n=1 Tax=Neglectibacter timonensis TaxID=1776382 RepID=UPI00210AA68A